MYHVAVDNDVPYKIYGNMQDDGTMRGLSTTQEAGANVPGQARCGGRPGRRGGGGGGRGGAGGGRGRRVGTRIWAAANPASRCPISPTRNIVWASCYGNEVTRYDTETKIARSVSPWLHTLDSEPDKAKYRCHWTPPLAIDPFDHNTRLLRLPGDLPHHQRRHALDGDQPGSFARAIPKYIVSSGGIVGDNLGQFYGEVVFSIAPSEIQKGLIWAGTNDGKVWYTRDAGADGEANWNDVTKNITGLPRHGRDLEDRAVAFRCRPRPTSRWIST